MQLIRESIFVSAVRSFCTSLASILGILLGLILIVASLLFFSGQSGLPPQSDVVIAPDGQGRRDPLPSGTPALLKLQIHGVIGTDSLTTEKFTNLLLDAQEGMFGHNRVKGILLCIDSPGGTVTDSNGIYQSLMLFKARHKVPIYAYVDGLCASGGMYIASAADKIFASSASAVGSVGVILGPNFNLSGLMDKYGVSALTLTEGKDKDMLNPFRPWKQGEETCLQNLIAASYSDFVKIVTDARPKLDREKLINEYGAQIYISREAEMLGYVDNGDSNYSQVVSELAKASGIADHEKYQVFQIEPPHSLLSDFAQNRFGWFEKKVFGSQLRGKLLYIYPPALAVP